MDEIKIKGGESFSGSRPEWNKSFSSRFLPHASGFFPFCAWQEFILNQDWNDPKSQLQQCCLTLRTEGKEPDIPLYK